MKSASFCLLTFSILTFFPATAQRLKKADKLIVANMQAHISYLDGKTLKERKAGSDGEKIAGDYIRKYFERYGLKARGDGGTWYQTFELNDGKEVQPATSFLINNEQLTLFKDYFPFAFSANKSAEGSVAIALAEDGFPWFKDLQDIIGDEKTAGKNILQATRLKAQHAAEKGATALIVYNSTGEDIAYDAKDSAGTVNIPVIYITKNAFKKYCADETATVDVKLNVSLEEKKRTTHNIIGYADNGADSTVVAGADLDNESNIAALLELVRLSKSIKPKKNNYLFVAFSGDENGTSGEKYFTTHAPIDLRKVNYTLDIDSVSQSAQYTNGLDLVKRSMHIMQDK